eukprot:Em0015g1045a
MLLLIALVHLKPSWSLELKRRREFYEQAVVERRGNFTPIVLSVDGVWDCQAAHVGSFGFFGDSAKQPKEPCCAEPGEKINRKERKRKRKDSDEENEEDKIMSKEEAGVDPSDQEDSSDSEGEEDGVCLLEGQAPIATKKGKKKPRTKRRKTKEVLSSVAMRQEMNAFRNSRHIYLTGSDVPDAVKSFEELQSSYCLSPYILRNVQASGYKEPTPIQMQAVQLMLQYPPPLVNIVIRPPLPEILDPPLGQEILACAPTGSGKTAAFIIPILAHLKEPKKAGFRAVVVSPTRELAQQTYREFVRLAVGSGMRIHVLTKAKATANCFGPQSNQRFGKFCHILVTTPSRLVHMLAVQPPSISLHKWVTVGCGQVGQGALLGVVIRMHLVVVLHPSSVEWLVLDEADKLFEPGTLGFRDQVAQIYSACDNPSIKHALFSATVASGVEEFCNAHFDSPVRVVVGVQNSAADLVKQELLFVGQEGGKLLAIRNLIQKGFTPPVLIFVQSIERAKELFHELIYDGLNVDVIHSERTQAQRDNVVKSFRAGKGVNLVINYDFPPSAVSYIHRIGRTGRAGRRGHAITFFTEDDALNLRSIANVMKASGCEVPDWMLKLKKPSKNTKRKLSKNPVKRSAIKTVSKYDLQKSRQKKEMISNRKLIIAKGTMVPKA